MDVAVVAAISSAARLPPRQAIEALLSILSRCKGCRGLIEKLVAAKLRDAARAGTLLPTALLARVARRLGPALVELYLVELAKTRPAAAIRLAYRLKQIDERLVDAVYWSLLAKAAGVEELDPRRIAERLASKPLREVDELAPGGIPARILEYIAAVKAEKGRLTPDDILYLAARSPGTAAALAYNEVVRALKERGWREAAALLSKLAPALRALDKSRLAKLAAAIVASSGSEVLDAYRVVESLAKRLGFPLDEAREAARTLLEAMVLEAKVPISKLNEAVRAGLLDRSEAVRVALAAAYKLAGGDPRRMEEILRENGFGWLLDELRSRLREALASAVGKVVEENPEVVAAALPETAKILALIERLKGQLERLREASSPEEAASIARETLSTIDELLEYKAMLDPKLAAEVEALRGLMAAIVSGRCSGLEGAARILCEDAERLAKTWDTSTLSEFAEVAKNLGATVAGVAEAIAVLYARLHSKTPEELAKRLMEVARAFGDTRLESKARDIEATARFLSMVEELLGQGGLLQQALESLQKMQFDRYLQLVDRVEELVKRILEYHDELVASGRRLLIPPEKLGEIMSRVGAVLDMLEAARKFVEAAARAKKTMEELRRKGLEPEALGALSVLYHELAKAFEEIARYARYAGLDERKLREYAELLMRASKDAEVLKRALSAVERVYEAARRVAEEWSESNARRLEAVLRYARDVLDEVRRHKFVLDERVWKPIVEALEAIFDPERSPLVPLMVQHPELIDILAPIAPRLADKARELLGAKTPVVGPALEALSKFIDWLKMRANEAWKAALEAARRGAPIAIPALPLSLLADIGAYLADFLTAPFRPEFWRGLAQLVESAAAGLKEAVMNPAAIPALLSGAAAALYEMFVKPFTPEELARHPGLAAAIVLTVALPSLLAKGGYERLARVFNALAGDPLEALRLVIDVKRLVPLARVRAESLERAVLEGAAAREELARLLEESGLERRAAERIAERLALLLERGRKAAVELAARDVAKLVAREVGIAAHELATLLERALKQKLSTSEAIRYTLAKIAEKFSEAKAAELRAGIKRALVEAARLAEEAELMATPENIGRLVYRELSRLQDMVEMLSKLSELGIPEIERMASEAASEIDAKLAATLERLRELEERLRRIGYRPRKLDILTKDITMIASALKKAVAGSTSIEELANELIDISRLIEHRNPELSKRLAEIAAMLRSRDYATVIEGISRLYKLLEEYVDVVRPVIVADAIEEAARRAGLEDVAKAAATGSLELLKSAVLSAAAKAEEAAERLLTAKALDFLKFYRELEKLAEAYRDIPPIYRALRDLLDALKPYVKRISARLWVPPVDVLRQLRESLERLSVALERAGVEPRLIRAAIQELDRGVVGPATLRLLEEIGAKSPYALTKIEKVVERMLAARGEPASVAKRLLERLRSWRARVAALLQRLRARSLREAASKLLEALRAAVEAGIRDRSLLSAVKAFLDVVKSDRVLYEELRGIIEDVERLAVEAERRARLEPLEGTVLEAVAEAKPLWAAPPEAIEAIKRLMEKPQRLEIGPFTVEQMLRRLDRARTELSVTLRIEPWRLARLLEEAGISREAAERIAEEIARETNGILYKAIVYADASACRKPGACRVRYTVAIDDRGIRLLNKLLDKIVKECAAILMT